MNRRAFLGLMKQIALAWGASATAGCIDFDALGKLYPDRSGDGGDPSPYDLRRPDDPYGPDMGPYDLRPYNYDANPYGPYDLSNPYSPSDFGNPYGMYGALDPASGAAAPRVGAATGRALAALLRRFAPRG